MFTGRSKEEEAQINQWLEYRVTHIDRCSSTQDVHQVLKVSIIIIEMSTEASRTFGPSGRAWKQENVLNFQGPKWQLCLSSMVILGLIL